MSEPIEPIAQHHSAAHSSAKVACEGRDTMNPAVPKAVSSADSRPRTPRRWGVHQHPFELARFWRAVAGLGPSPAALSFSKFFYHARRTVRPKNTVINFLLHLRPHLLHRHQMARWCCSGTRCRAVSLLSRDVTRLNRRRPTNRTMPLTPCRACCPTVVVCPNAAGGAATWDALPTKSAPQPPLHRK